MTSRLSMRRVRGSCEPCQKRACNSSLAVSTSSICFNRGVKDETTKGRLERSDLPGDELDDWLGAERELQKALFANEAGIVFSSSTTRTLRKDIDIQRMETMERRNQ